MEGGLGRPVVRILEERGHGLRIWAGECPPNKEKARKEGIWGWRAWGLGKVDPAKTLSPAAPAALASALPRGCCLWAGAAHHSGPSFFLGRGESAETRARPGGSAGGPRR